MFLPEGFIWNDVPDRVFMSRAVASVRAPASNEDLAIVTFNHLLGNMLNFIVVRNIIREFLAQRGGAVSGCHALSPRTGLCPIQACI